MQLINNFILVQYYECDSSNKIVDDYEGIESVIDARMTPPRRHQGNDKNTFALKGSIQVHLKRELL